MIQNILLQQKKKKKKEARSEVKDTGCESSKSNLSQIPLGNVQSNLSKP